MLVNPLRMCSRRRCSKFRLFRSSCSETGPAADGAVPMLLLLPVLNRLPGLATAALFLTPTAGVRRRGPVGDPAFPHRLAQDPILLIRHRKARAREVERAASVCE